MKFKEYKGLDLAGIAADVLGEWDAHDTFHKSISTREGHPAFVFYEGPPSANGMPGIEHRAAVMYTAGVATGRISVQELCRVLSETPAKLFGLYPRKGLLAPGSDADIAVYDPRRDGLITAARQHQNCDYSPYEGFKTSGSLRDVFLRGVQVFKDGELKEPGRGRYLRRSRAFCAPE